ncbi:hypothetical protein GH733_016791 [Mirounga leonina]|nr:hypothetical protein GH733_016791 [Mirounga leonina]
MAGRPALWRGLLLLLSLGGSSAPGRKTLRVRQVLPRGPGLTPSPLCPTASLLRRLREHIQQFQESSGLSLTLGPGAGALPKQGWLGQPLDPFNTSDRRSFLQRYWVNDQHWASQHGPVFLHLGGESRLGSGSVMRGKKQGGETQLGSWWGQGGELRLMELQLASPPTIYSSQGTLQPWPQPGGPWFYGLSIPAGGLDVAQLGFLSSRHALADVASARLALARLFNVSTSSPWICFGGSYAGSLAAWARLKFPHLIFASVASSAPVRAVLDFSEYNEVSAAGGGCARGPQRGEPLIPSPAVPLQVVSRSLTSTAVGGSPECLAAASAAFAEVERRLRAGPGARAALRAELGACSSLGRTEDQAELLGALQALVGGVVQYDAQAGVPLSVRRLCGLLLEGRSNGSRSAPYLGLRRAVQVVLHSLGQRCLSFSRAETVAQLKVTAPHVSSMGERQWLYQTCTEFGFYVTCEDPGCPFSQLPALPSQLELCERVFGLSASSIARAVAQTNSYYGGQTPGATQVLFTNGDTDPWHVLSVTRASGPSESALLIPGASHCMDMAPKRPSDSPSLRLGRQSIFQQLQAWLGPAKGSQESPVSSGG